MELCPGDIRELLIMLRALVTAIDNIDAESAIGLREANQLSEKAEVLLKTYGY